MKGISNKRVNRLAVFALIGGLVCSQAAFAAKEVSVAVAPKQTWGTWFSSAWNTTKGKLSNASNAKDSVVCFTTETIPTKASSAWTTTKNGVTGFVKSGYNKAADKASAAKAFSSTKLAEVKASNFVKGATQAVVNNPKMSVVLAGVTAGLVAKAVYDSGVVGKTAKAAKKNPKTVAAIATPVVAGAGYLAWINLFGIDFITVALGTCKAAVVANPTLAALGAASILGGSCLKYFWTNLK
ncbi:hypothetical protein HRU45_02360 [Candidatus Dependentiae bacterium]|nr:hypothetical protein [Candidatus Dependentiae bacterium]